MDAECNGEIAAPWANPRTDSDDVMSLCHLLQSVGFVPSRLKENWHQTNSHHAMVHRHRRLASKTTAQYPVFWMQWNGFNIRDNHDAVVAIAVAFARSAAVVVARIMSLSTGRCLLLLLFEFLFHIVRCYCCRVSLWLLCGMGIVLPSIQSQLFQ